MTVFCLVVAMLACGGAPGPSAPPDPPPILPEEPPPPPPPVSTVYFKADAESGSMSDWSLPWGVVSSPGSPLPALSLVHAKSGTHSYLYEARPGWIEGRSATMCGP